jgi:pilus assembly protein Flp/PilA
VKADATHGSSGPPSRRQGTNCIEPRAHRMAGPTGPDTRVFDSHRSRRNTMFNAIEQVRRFVRDEEGVTAIEYGLIAALIAVGIILALSTIGKDLKTVFSTIAADLDSAVSGI